MEREIQDSWLTNKELFTADNNEKREDFLSFSKTAIPIEQEENADGHEFLLLQKSNHKLRH